MSNKRQAGVTLVELIVAIVIVGVALAGMVAVFTRIDRASVDPVITQQMAIVAEGMMEEILLKDFANANPVAARSAATQVGDYAGYASNGIVDVEGNAIPGLASYSIAVRISNVALADVPADDSRRIEVTVTNEKSENPNQKDQVRLVGWRTRPPAAPVPAPAPQGAP